MDIDYSLNAIRIQKTGFFYQGERKVKYSEFNKPTDSARQKKRHRELMKSINSWANEFAKGTYNYYLKTIARKMAAVEFPSDAPKAQLSEETLMGVRSGAITQQILEGVRSGAITRKTIRDEMVKSVLEDLNKNRELSGDFHPIDKQQFGSKSLSASEISDKETEVWPSHLLKDMQHGEK